MAKVGLTVVTYKDNFGSALQTYATQHVVRKNGYETSIFDISKLHRSIKVRKILYYCSRLIHTDERRYVFNNAKSSVKKSATGEYANNMALRHKMYQEFYNEKLNFFPKAESWDDLRKQCKLCESVIVGSDQLWGPANIAGKYFTLEFVPDNVKKIAYSTSFGVSVLPKQLYKHANLFLKRLDHISVRETSGQKIIKEVAGLNASVVCDPTMLLTADEWMDIQENEPFTEGRYILTYFMGDNPEQREFVTRLKEKTGCKIVGLLHGSTYIHNDEKYCDEAPYDVGPGEFLNLIRNAQYVCTDSFHCCVFSILYNKNFFAFRREKDDSAFNTNDRIYTLLNWTNLGNRLLDGYEDIDDNLCTDINYAPVNKVLKIKREEGLEYLKKSLVE